MPKELPQIRLERPVARAVKESAKKSKRSFPAEAAYLIALGLLYQSRK